MKKLILSPDTAPRNHSPFVILSLALVTSALLLHSVQAEALPQLPPRGPIPFYLYDINSNGAISQDEFNTIRGQRMQDREARGYPVRDMSLEPDFNQFDINDDDHLSPEELARGQVMQQQKRRQMRQTPGMGQGQKQANMMRSGMNGGHKMPQFEAFDVNKDGVLTPEEFTQGLQQHRQQRMAMRQKQSKSIRPGDCLQKGQQRGMGMGRNRPSFTDFDANKDGYISEQELIEARSMRISKRIQQAYPMRNTANIAQFAEIDQNADGKISPQEFSEQQQKHRMNHQRPQ